MDPKRFLWSSVTVAEKNTKTLVLVCHQDFCRILERVLRSEGLSDFQHSDLSLVGSPAVEARVEVATEVFLAPTDAERVEKLISRLRAFRDKGRFSELLASVPAKVILDPKTALRGAAAYLASFRN